MAAGAFARGWNNFDTIRTGMKLTGIMDGRKDDNFSTSPLDLRGPLCDHFTDRNHRDHVAGEVRPAVKIDAELFYLSANWKRRRVAK